MNENEIYENNEVEENTENEIEVVDNYDYDGFVEDEEQADAIGKLLILGGGIAGGFILAKVAPKVKEGTKKVIKKVLPFEIHRKEKVNTESATVEPIDVEVTEVDEVAK